MAHLSAINHIRSWTVEDVLKVLTRYGLEDCCVVFKKRELDGDALLHLTEGKLALWKKDISMTTMRKLSQFVVDINLYPDRYVQEDIPPQRVRHMGVPTLPPRPSTPASDTGSWDTDFEDDEDEEFPAPPPVARPEIPQKPPLPERPPGLQRNFSTLHNNTAMLTPHTNNSNFRSSSPLLNNGIHNNKSPQNNRRTVQNTSSLHHTSTLPNNSMLHSNALYNNKTNLHNPRTLHNTSVLHSLPKPPVPQLGSIISGLNLNNDDDDDEYQSIDDQLITPQTLGFPPPRKLTPTELPSPRKLSFTEVPPPRKPTPPSGTNIYPTTMPPPRKPPMPLPVPAISMEFKNNFHHPEAEGQDWEADEYEVITDETDCYLEPSVPAVPVKPRQESLPPPPDIVAPSSHPPSPPRMNTPAEDSSDWPGVRLSDKLRTLMRSRQTSNMSTASMEDLGSREKLSPSLEQRPLSGERPGQRPLPPTPDPTWKGAVSMSAPRKVSKNYTLMPWFHNVNRKRAEDMLKNGKDGQFILRPSTQTQNPLTLTLRYNKRFYNIGVRQRPDQCYALGTEKSKEQSFTSVEEMIQHYQRELLVLHSGGEETGKTLLTTSPPQMSS